MTQSEINKITWKNPETRKKRCEGISRAKIGKYCGNGFKKGQKSWNKGLTKETDIRLEKISKQHTGKKMPPGTSEKCSIAQKKRDKSTFNISGFKKGWQLNRKGKDNGRWQGGISFEPYSVDWTETLKRSIRERDHYTCQLCNKPQGDRAHDIHHIDYNKKNCNPVNLITLCAKCNTKVNYNRQYWTNYFQELMKIKK